jgi:hypothetical protein
MCSEIKKHVGCLSVFCSTDLSFLPLLPCFGGKSIFDRKIVLARFTRLHGLFFFCVVGNGVLCSSKDLAMNLFRMYEFKSSHLRIQTNLL